ncbi:putative protein serine/threonine kinase activity [Lyophyllum shimeji]|uniref:Protein kinase domain-containing protein n=1 Tax=Lyophyllum shimeji TaxID=47721 RepID=A0A9P3UQ59_LYOSH|nr:putative protein serine/threonine kinase activity [Lyophyllum shimeji]
MDPDDIAIFPTASLSTAWLPRTGLIARSIDSPNRKIEHHLAFRKSTSLPYGLFPAGSAADVAAEEIEDATLYYIQPPSYADSYADLTACASQVLNNLASSGSQFFKPTLASTVSIVRLAQTQPRHLDSVQKTINEVPQLLSSDLWPADAHQGLEDLIPSIPSILSTPSESAREGTAFDALRASSPHRAQPLRSYAVIGTVGRGTYGKVVLACMKDNLDGELYAVKIIRTQDKREIVPELATLHLISSSPRTSTDDGLLFLQQLREAFREDNCLFLVMEYHPATLSDPGIASRFRIRELQQPGLSPSVSLPLTFNGHLSPASALSDEPVLRLRLLIAEISLGLAFLHDRGIVHQDIKPANIMISFAGHAVIGDFGAATEMPLTKGNAAGTGPSPLLDDDTAGTRLRRYGPIVLHADDFVTFTPLYAAPELRERNCAGLVVYDERSDWWSLGVLLYELVTGTAPFQAHFLDRAGIRGRRSDGDHSLAFGALEILSGPFKAAECGWYPYLEDFLRSLLSHYPADRLRWPGIKDHAFMDPLRGRWCDIANLKYPPCPDPPASYVDDDTSLMVEEADDAESCDMEPDEDAESAPRGDHSIDGDSDSSLHISLGICHSTAQTAEGHSSDSASIPRPLTSSASLFWAADCLPELHGPTFRLPSDMLGSLGSHDFHLANAQPLQSPLFSTPILGFLSHHSSVLSHAESKYAKMQEAHHPLPIHDFVVPEEITISLLEAMDHRDQAAQTGFGTGLEEVSLLICTGSDVV